MFKKIVIYIVLLCTCIIVITSNVIGASYIYNKNNLNDNNKKNEQISEKVNETNNESKTEKTKQVIATQKFDFKSEAQILIETNTGKVLYENNADVHLLPASVTKVMTLLLTMEQIDSGKLKYEDSITCSKKASEMGGSQIWFKPGEKLSLNDCIKAICVVSANDVTYAVAEHIGGTEENFVNMMNERAKKLGMNNTCFKNCHGIDEEGHYTCARDIATMSRELIVKHPNILKYSSIWMDSLRDGSFNLSNTNKLIKYYEGATGLKTGYTSNALYNLSASATRNNTSFIAVIMKAPSSEIRNQEAMELLNYGFSNYETSKIYEKDYVVDNIKIEGNVLTNVDVKLKENVAILKEKGDKKEFESSITYNNNIKAPIKAETVIGEMIFKDKETGDILSKNSVYIDKDVDKSNFIDYFKVIFKIFMCKNFK